MTVADNEVVSECNSNKNNKISSTEPQGTLIDLSIDGQSASETMKKLVSILFLGTLFYYLKHTIDSKFL